MDKRALISAFLLHLSLVLMLIFFVSRHQTSLVKNHSAQIEMAYLVSSINPSRAQVLVPTQKSVEMPQGDSSLAPPKETKIVQPKMLATLQNVKASQTQITQLLQIIAKTIAQHLSYPESAKAQIEQGQALVKFELQSDGQMNHIAIVQSSGAAILDASAINAIVLSSPIVMPKINSSFPLTLVLPVDFKLR